MSGGALVAATVELRLAGHALDIEHGQWCEACALPSGYTALLVITLAADPTRVVSRSRLTGCVDCGAATTSSA